MTRHPSFSRPPLRGTTPVSAHTMLGADREVLAATRVAETANLLEKEMGYTMTELGAMATQAALLGGCLPDKPLQPYYPMTRRSMLCYTQLCEFSFVAE